MQLRQYIVDVERHTKMLQALCQQEEINVPRAANRIIKSIVEEVNEKMSACSCNEVKDACLVSGLQLINHFKVRAYGTGATYAESAGLEDMASILYKASVDERYMDEELTHLAIHEINKKAMTPLFN